MEVYSVPWRKSTEILWDESSCTKPQPDPADVPCVGCPAKVEVDQIIVDFAMSQLSYGDCQKNNVQVDNFHKQVCFKVVH